MPRLIEHSKQFAKQYASRLAVGRGRGTTRGYTKSPTSRYPLGESSWRPNAAVIKMEISGVLAHRDVALRVVSAACKLVTPQPQGTAWNDFQMKVVSAVSEAFNNIVEHGYQSREPGPIELEIGISAGRIEIDLRDWGVGFDPKAVPTPDLAALPEGGLGLFIIQSFMELDYRPGTPNILRLTKSLEHPQAGLQGSSPPGDHE